MCVLHSSARRLLPLCTNSNSMMQHKNKKSFLLCWAYTIIIIFLCRLLYTKVALGVLLFIITTYYLYNKKPPLLIYIFFYIVDQIAAEKVVVKVVPIYFYDDTTHLIV